MVEGHDKGCCKIHLQINPRSIAIDVCDEIIARFQQKSICNKVPTTSEKGRGMNLRIGL
jgi:hypothetical protein